MSYQRTPKSRSSWVYSGLLAWGVGVGGVCGGLAPLPTLFLRFSPVSFAFANSSHALLCPQIFHFPSESGGRSTPCLLQLLGHSPVGGVPLVKDCLGQKWLGRCSAGEADALSPAAEPRDKGLFRCPFPLLTGKGIVETSFSRSAPGSPMRVLCSLISGRKMCTESKSNCHWYPWTTQKRSTHVESLITVKTFMKSSRQCVTSHSIPELYRIFVARFPSPLEPKSAIPRWLSEVAVSPQNSWLFASSPFPLVPASSFFFPFHPSSASSESLDQFLYPSLFPMFSPFPIRPSPLPFRHSPIWIFSHSLSGTLRSWSLALLCFMFCLSFFSSRTKCRKEGAEMAWPACEALSLSLEQK